ncbi:PotD/PotF family extracellular solute-binding protein [Marinibaculum pumilum]|uniref:PotD/PotF family extracellular solute-binding protein n=1 Tax=Marinibaculum pumilum TaxID=1766165 RepID=A0ABV7L5G6_9PROT
MKDEKSSVTKGTRKGFSRRTMLKGSAAAAGVAIGSGAIKGFPTIWAQNIKDVELRIAGLSVSNMPQVEELAKKDLGLTIKMQAIDIPVIIQRGLTQPKSVDILDTVYLAMKVIWPSGNFQAIDANKIKLWDKVVGTFKTGKLDSDAWYGQGQNPSSVQFVASPDAKQFSPEQTEYLSVLPFINNADTLGIRPDLIGHKVESWKELINPEFKGKAALIGFPGIGFMDAAMALEAEGLVKYEDKGNPTKQEIDATVDILQDLKNAGHWRSFWNTFIDSVNLMASGEVVIQSMWSPAVTAVKSKGIPCEYVALKEGYRSWGLGLMLPSHLEGLKLDAAYEYLNWMYSGVPGAFFARQGYYSPVPETVKATLEPYEWDFWYEGKPAEKDIIDPFGTTIDKAGSVRDGGSYKDRMGRVAIWNTIPSENEYLTQKWNSFIAT